ncbi:glycoside hydrolase family 16 protein [Streptomyces sp. NBC_00286]|uniref:glycoside hydrolase family 16 protein n=1 Tax=Streptomyces sp. NBC_00286 TaxID=2975701 RepID=UPI002E2CB6C6|nr:glycoside hydrolase family 16 protein [Streptomyces sp. NBC_00286]
MLPRRLRQALAAMVLLLAVACGGEQGLAAPPVSGNWKLAFHDEFDGSELDTDKWATCYDWNRKGCTNSGNDEEQWYLPGQVSVGRGALTLSAERRTTRGSDGRTYPWKSGMISTGRDHWDARPRSTFTYGYFEAAIRIPPQAGMFPAFWMMPASRFTPPELDIMEFLGDTQRVFMYAHWRGPDGDSRARGSYGPVAFPAKYHVFALLWTPDELSWYVDGVRRFRVTEPERIPHVPMEVLVNLAVGVPKSPPRSVDSAEMKVDWVRVWQR